MRTTTLFPNQFVNMRLLVDVAARRHGDPDERGPARCTRHFRLPGQSRQHRRGAAGCAWADRAATAWRSNPDCRRAIAWSSMAPTSCAAAPGSSLRQSAADAAAVGPSALRMHPPPAAPAAAAAAPAANGLLLAPAPGAAGTPGPAARPRAPAPAQPARRNNASATITAPAAPAQQPGGPRRNAQ